MKDIREIIEEFQEDTLPDFESYEDILKGLRKAINQTLETQALALEGMKKKLTKREDLVGIIDNHVVDQQIKARNQALQQAADHLRAQKIAPQDNKWQGV